MPRNSAGSMFGGAGGRGSRVSVANLAALRNVLRNNDDPERDSAAPADDKKTMRGLNERLSGYLGRVGKLEKANRELEDRINHILAKRGAPAAGRDWDATEKPLADLRKKVKAMTMNNAKLLLQIDNTKMANEDFKTKVDAEKRARHTIEQDLVGLRKTIEDTQLNRMQLESQIEAVKEELAFLQKEHKEDVYALRKRIKESNVVVEMDSPDSNLAETLNSIRDQYEKLAKKNQKDTEDWYQSKFDNIKVEVALNTEALESGKTELNELHKQKQLLEIDVQALLSMIRSLEETLTATEERYGRELARLQRILSNLEEELSQVKAQVEHQVEDYQDLLHVKMKLEEEISNYRRLLHGITTDADDKANAGPAKTA